MLPPSIAEISLRLVSLLEVVVPAEGSVEGF